MTLSSRIHFTKLFLEQALCEERRQLAQQVEQESLERQELFDDYADSPLLEIFNLPGLEFHIFRHNKIKFSFHPASVTNFVNKNVRFYVSLKYVDKYWRVKRDSLPANYKLKIYNLFYSTTYFKIDDEKILQTLLKIYDIFITWTHNEEEFRVNKFQVGNKL